MKKLVVAIDCDDVLVSTTEYIVKTYNELYGTAVQLRDAYKSGNPQWMAEREEVYRRLCALQMTPEYAMITPHDFVVDHVKKLAANHELHLVTARDEAVMDVTHRMLDEYYPNCFQTIEHVGPDRPKGEVCRALGADIIIDDNLRHLVSARANGVEHLIWFGEYPWQDRSEEMPDGIILCHNWAQVGEEIERIAG